MSKDVKQNNGIKPDVWQLTRTDGIENNYRLYHIRSTKEIAATARKHIKNRFPMCKWSVRKDGNSIYIRMLESPWDIDSEIVKAIAHYAYTYLESYNYDNSDIMTDYFDVNFYGNYESDIVSSYEYSKREATDDEVDMENAFIENKKTYDEEIRKRKEQEHKEWLAKYEQEKEENRKREIQRKENHKIVENNVRLEDVDFFVLGCDTTSTRKEDSIDGYTDDCDGKIELKHFRENCRVTRAVYMTRQTYDIFTNQLMDDYTFLDGMGGSATDDARITDIIDYHMMSKNERESVEWYNTSCVAIYCDNILKLIVNPEGYSYARYVYFVDEESKIVEKYETAKGIDENRLNDFKVLANELKDASVQIISDNGFLETWNTHKLSEYKGLMKEWIYKNNFPLNENIIRVIEENELKTIMYSLLKDISGVKEQFLRADLKPNQKITVVSFNDFGGIYVSKVYFNEYICATYSQYTDAVKMIFKPKGKNKFYYKWYYNDFLVFDGWHDIPSNLLYEEEKNETGDVILRKTKYLSCDREQYDVIINYFLGYDIKPIINTYKPSFGGAVKYA